MATFIAGKGFTNSHEVEVLLASRLVEKPEEYKKYKAAEPCIPVVFENGITAVMTRNSIFEWKGEFRVSLDEKGVLVEPFLIDGSASCKYWLR